MKEHIEARLARVLAHDVGGCEVKQRGAQLGADGVEEHGLAAALGPGHQHRLDGRGVLPELGGAQGQDAVLRYKSSDISWTWCRLHAPGLELGPPVRDVADVLLEADLGVELDHIVHYQLLKQGLSGPVGSQILVLLLLSLLTSFLALLSLLADLSLLTLVSFNSLLQLTIKPYTTKYIY